MKSIIFVLLMHSHSGDASPLAAFESIEQCRQALAVASGNVAADYHATRERRRNVDPQRRSLLAEQLAPLYDAHRPLRRASRALRLLQAGASTPLAEGQEHRFRHGSRKQAIYDPRQADSERSIVIWS